MKCTCSGMILASESRQSVNAPETSITAPTAMQTTESTRSPPPVSQEVVASGSGSRR
jgi:hypothetical protein